MNEHSFSERLEWSKGKAGDSDKATIMALIPGCESVREGNEWQDRRGIDFVATLRRGAEVFIDVKRRERGVSRFWPDGPELTVEKWSVRPTEHKKGVVGWTLDERKLTDYILYVFDKSDCDEAFLIPFQLLRKAYRNNYKFWNDRFRAGICNTEGRYETESIFVPVDTVLDAVTWGMSYQFPEAERPEQMTFNVAEGS